MDPIKYSTDGTDHQMEPIGGDDITTHDIHVRYVYADPDFTADLAKLEEQHGKEITDAILRTGSTKSDEVMAFFSQLADGWGLSIAEATNAYNGTNEGGRLVREADDQPMIIDWNSLLHERRFTVDFNIEELRKSDLDELWQIVSNRKAELGLSGHKNKTVENSRLIYAIFKARKNGHTFTQIYWDYFYERLVGYTGSGKILGDADSLARYYRKYKP